MKVEQRIGRIDRLGQEYKQIRIINLHYEGTKVSRRPDFEAIKPCLLEQGRL